ETPGIQSGPIRCGAAGGAAAGRTSPDYDTQSERSEEFSGPDRIGSGSERLRPSPLYAGLPRSRAPSALRTGLRGRPAHWASKRRWEVTNYRLLGLIFPLTESGHLDILLIGVIMASARDALQQDAIQQSEWRFALRGDSP